MLDRGFGSILGSKITLPKSIGNGSGMVGVAEMGPETSTGSLGTGFWPLYIDFTRISPNGIVR